MTPDPQRRHCLLSDFFSEPRLWPTDQKPRSIRTLYRWCTQGRIITDTIFGTQYVNIPATLAHGLIPRPRPSRSRQQPTP